MAEPKLVASAVVHQKQVFIGKRHPDAIKNAVQATGVSPVIGEQGFIDENGEFYSRYTAEKIALRNGQLKESPEIGLLISEDLW